MSCERIAPSPLSYTDKVENILKIKAPWVKVPMHLHLIDVLCNPICRHLLVDLIGMASLKKGYTILNNERVCYEYGQIVTTYRKLQCYTGIPQQKLRHALRQLSSSGFIEIAPTQRYTTITICNWDIYHRIPDTANTSIPKGVPQSNTSNRASSRSKSLLNKNIECCKNKELDIEIREREDTLRLTKSDDMTASLEVISEVSIVDDDLLIKAVNELRIIGHSLDLAIESKEWIDRWRKVLREVLEKIRKDFKLEHDRVLIAIRALLLSFFRDKARRKRNSQRALYFLKDWDDYWPIAMKQLEKH